MSFFGKKHEAPAYCQAGGAAPPLQVTVTWPGLCAPTACDSGMAAAAGPGLLLPMPMPMPGPRGGCCDDPCQAAPCGAGGCVPSSTVCKEPCEPTACGAGDCAAALVAPSVHPEACEANPMVLYGDFHKQDLGGEIHDMHIEKDLMQAERQKLEAIEEDMTKSWGHLEEMLQSQTSDPMGHDHSLVLMVMSRKSTQHCVDTFKDMKLRNPMKHEAMDNRLFRVIKTHAPKPQSAKNYENADILYYDFQDKFVDEAKEGNMQQRILGRIKQTGLQYPRQLQGHGAEWILIRSSSPHTNSMIFDIYGTKCEQVEFNKSYYTLCRLYEEPMKWPKPQYDDEYKASQPLENGDPKFFDSYQTQKKLLRELFYGSNSKYKDSYGYDMLDIRDYLLKHPDWRAGYHDLMCANVHYGQYKLLERSIFLILFAAYKYKKKQFDEKGEDLSIDDVLKRLTCVYLGGGTPTPGKEDQHFPLLLKLIPHFLLVSYDVHKPDIGGAFDKKHVFEPEYKTSDAQAWDDSAFTNRKRLLLIQKMCDYNEVQKIRNTMNATAQKTVDEKTQKESGERFYVVIQDIRTDVSLILCELESYRIVIKRLVYAVRQDQEDHTFLGPEKRDKFMKDIRETLSQKQVLRKKMQNLVQNDNICQMIFANVFCEAPNCMAVSAKWTFEYPNSRMDTSMADCPDGMTIHQSFLGASTEHTAMMTTSIHNPDISFTYVNPGNATEWGKTQEEGRWTNLEVGRIEEGRFITNQYELVVPSSLKVDYRKLCGEIRKNSVDGLVAYLQLKDPREEHIGAGTKFMVLHMYAQMCNDLRDKHPDQTPDFLWERMQHAQAQALRKKTHALQHAWYFSRDIENTLTMPITAEEFENLPNANIETFVQQISNYKASTKMETEKKKSIDSGYCLRLYTGHLRDGSSIWDFTEEGYITAIVLSLQNRNDINQILSTCTDDEQKCALGQMLMRLCDQYHVMAKANIQRLPELKEELLSVVDNLKYWPGFGLQKSDRRLAEYALNKGMRTRDVYCNLFLPVVLTDQLRTLMQNLNVHALYNGIKAYLQLDDSGRLLWPMANGNTRKFYDYPSNRSYLELAMLYDIVPLLELIFKKVYNDGNETLVEQTQDECPDILEKEFRKKDGNYTYPLNQAAYSGSEKAVRYWVDQCKKYNATDIIPQRHHYKTGYSIEQLSALNIARNRLLDLKSPNRKNDHPANAVEKYNRIIAILTPYENHRARPRRQPNANTGTRAVSGNPRGRPRGAGGAEKGPANSAAGLDGASRNFQTPVLKQDPSKPAPGVQAPAKQSWSEVPATPASSKEAQKTSVGQADSTTSAGVQAPTTQLWSKVAAKPTYMNMLQNSRVVNGGSTSAPAKARQDAAVRAGTGTTQPGARAQAVQPDTRVAAGTPAPPTAQEQAL